MCERAMSGLVEVVVMLGVRALPRFLVGVLCVGGGRFIGSDRTELNKMLYLASLCT